MQFDPGGDTSPIPLCVPEIGGNAHPGARVLGGEVAVALQETSLCLPSSVGLSLDEVDRIVACISEFERRRRRTR